MPMQASASNLVDELGHVDYVFSDKTGTLTKNVMEFRRFTAGNKSYGQMELPDDPTKMMNQLPHVCFYDPDKEVEQTLIYGEEDDQRHLKEFLLALALSHTIVEDKEGTQKNLDLGEKDTIVYSAASPDELALVNFAK